MPTAVAVRESSGPDFPTALHCDVPVVRRIRQDDAGVGEEPPGIRDGGGFTVTKPRAGIPWHVVLIVAEPPLLCAVSNPALLSNGTLGSSRAPLRARRRDISRRAVRPDADRGHLRGRPRLRQCEKIRPK